MQARDRLLPDVAIAPERVNPGPGISVQGSAAIECTRGSTSKTTASGSAAP